MAAEADVCSQVRESISEDHIFEAINLIRYEKKRRPDRESLLKLLQKDIEVTTFEFNKLLDTLLENGSVNTKITSTGKESFFNNEDLENEKLANLMASLYDGANDESLRSDALTVETHENDRSVVDCCKETKNIVEAHMRRIDSLFNEMNLRLFTTLSEEREILKNFSKEITLLREENKSLKDQIFYSSLPTKSTKSTKTQTLAVAKDLDCEAGIVAKETITIDNSESLSTKINRQLDKARSDSKNKFYAYKEATLSASHTTKAHADNKNEFNTHKEIAADSTNASTQDLTESGVLTIESKHIDLSTKPTQAKSDSSIAPSNVDSTRVSQNNAVWPKGTTLLVGDSMIGGVFENWIAPAKKIKVRTFPGAVVNDLFDYLRPLLRKKPSRVIIHVGTNDANKANAKEITDKLLRLRKFVLSELNECSVILSSPVNRVDSTKQGIVVRNVNVILKNISNIEVIDNSNISVKHLGKKGLHLNPSGTTMLVRNILNCMKRI